MDELIQLIDEVRLLEHRLFQVAEWFHGTATASVAERGVMEFLLRHGPTSVPDTARARLVSRQHIQVIVDGLTTRDLVAPATNPAHRRSPLFGLTAEGRATITAMHRRELALMKARFGKSGLTTPEVETASRVLAAIRAALDPEDLR